MSILTRKMIIDALAKHKYLTAEDMALKGNLGFVPDKFHLSYLLRQLSISGHVLLIRGFKPLTYSITQKGINAFSNRLISPT